MEGDHDQPAEWRQGIEGRLRAEMKGKIAQTQLPDYLKKNNYYKKMNSKASISLVRDVEQRTREDHRDSCLASNKNFAELHHAVRWNHDHGKWLEGRQRQIMSYQDYMKALNRVQLREGAQARQAGRKRMDTFDSTQATMIKDYATHKAKVAGHMASQQ